MKIFLGIGLGPIQTGIFVSGAAKGGFDRIVVAEVDETVKNAVNADGAITVNIAAADHVFKEKYPNLELYSPAKPEELEKLIDAAANATEIATALPSVKFFAPTAAWLREGFRRNPNGTRYIYTAENDNHAAEKLEKEIGEAFPNTYYLNTVIGKMSDVARGEDVAKRELTPLATGLDRAHLVEEFNWILISNAPGIENRQVQSLYVKNDLFPFEFAKLYGHNATHFLLGMLGASKGLKTMADLSAYPELLEIGRQAFINESGVALCRKYAGVDDMFTEEGMKNYAEGLIARMQNPYLSDAIERVIRDIPRKLSWDDRAVGTMRLALSQGVKPYNFAKGALLAAQREFGNDPAAIRSGLIALWQKDETDKEAAEILELILNAQI
ncbi:MAG: hypothetical protein J6W81_03410 [Lentisphaeria bacterium]|nr:hypothetical protein [Lentisphaeria bacterium]